MQSLYINKQAIFIINDQDFNTDSMNINDNIIEPAEEIKNLGVIFDHSISMSAQVNNLCKNLVFQLHQKASSIRPFITEEAAKTLVTTLILYRIDYCNSLLSGITKENINKLQLIQNHAAKLVKKKKKYDHVRPLLIDLHWLPVSFRIDYKIGLLCFKIINNLAPIYLKNIIHVMYLPTKTISEIFS